MSSKRQIDANRKNAQLSTGPKTLEGKAISRGNSLKHGLSGEGVVATPEESREFEQRLEEWRPSFKKELEGNDVDREFLFRQVVLNSIRMTAAQDRESSIHHAQKQHAIHNWDSDRKQKAETLGASLSKSPSLILAKLENFLQGCEWLIAQWIMLRGFLKTSQNLVDGDQLSMLDDLLGIARTLRDKDSTIEVDDALSIVEDALKRLKGGSRLEDLRTLDLQDRIAAENGFEREISREERLNRRYEDLATKRFNIARNELKAARPEPAPVPTPEPVEEAPAIDDEPQFTDEELELQIQAQLKAMGLPYIRYPRNEPSATLGKLERTAVGSAARTEAGHEGMATRDRSSSVPS